MTFSITRRGAIMTGASLFASPFIPKAWGNTSPDSRFLVIILRGGLDGLGTILPTGDPDFMRIRADFDSPHLADAHRLDGLFSLNPVLPNVARLYDRKEALFFHAIATPYRARSHFDAQEVLENGMPQSGTGTDTGWLNRGLSAMQPARGVKIAPRAALAVAATTPLILRGAAPVESWQPQVLSYAQADTVARLQSLYQARDMPLADALREGVRVDDFLNDAPLAGQARRMQAGTVGGFPAAASAAARLMAAPDGPRIAVMNFDGWDTHMMEAPYDGRLAKNLKALDGGIAALEKDLGPVWKDSAVLIVTEFGRTVHVNGSRGTDHGNGGIAMLLGGRVNGGRVVADWPGLSDKALFEGRDLMPTTDLRAVLKGLLAAQLDIGASTLADSIFPGSASVKPMMDLLRT